MKYFNIFKVNKKSDKQPDYRISMKIGDNYEEIGAGWIKGEGDKRFISCKLNEAYVDNTKGIAKKGFMLVNDAEFPKPPEIKKESDGLTSDGTPVPF